MPKAILQRNTPSNFTKVSALYRPADISFCLYCSAFLPWSKLDIFNMWKTLSFGPISRSTRTMSTLSSLLVLVSVLLSNSEPAFFSFLAESFRARNTHCPPSSGADKSTPLGLVRQASATARRVLCPPPFSPPSSSKYNPRNNKLHHTKHRFG